MELLIIKVNIQSAVYFLIFSSKIDSATVVVDIIKPSEFLDWLDQPAFKEIHTVSIGQQTRTILVEYNYFTTQLVTFQEITAKVSVKDGNVIKYYDYIQDVFIDYILEIIAVYNKTADTAKFCGFDIIYQPILDYVPGSTDNLSRWQKEHFGTLVGCSPFELVTARKHQLFFYIITCTSFFSDNYNVFKVMAYRKDDQHSSQSKEDKEAFLDNFETLITLIAKTDDIEQKKRYQIQWELLLKDNKSIKDIVFSTNNPSDFTQLFYWKQDIKDTLTEDDEQNIFKDIDDDDLGR